MRRMPFRNISSIYRSSLSLYLSISLLWYTKRYRTTAFFSHTTPAQSWTWSCLYAVCLPILSTHILPIWHCLKTIMTLHNSQKRSDNDCKGIRIISKISDYFHQNEVSARLSYVRSRWETHIKTSQKRWTETGSKQKGKDLLCFCLVSISFIFLFFYGFATLLVARNWQVLSKCFFFFAICFSSVASAPMCHLNTLSPDD